MAESTLEHRRHSCAWRRSLIGLLAATLLVACGRTPSTGAPRTAASSASRAQSTPLPKFPPGFMWGVSTAGYQWEGQDTSSQWAAFDAAGRTSERNPRGADGLVRYEEDMSLTRGLGCNVFRTSIEWARIEPAEGVRDPKAIAHYHRLLTAMRARGLEPVVTLMHFAYPAWLDRYGGWESPQAVAAFKRHAAFVAREFGADVRWYMTFNEPNVFLIGGWLSPMMPPGKVAPLAGLRAMRRMVRAHAEAYDAVHAEDPDAMVSFNMYTAEWAFGAPSPPLSAADSRDPSKVAEHELCSETAFADALMREGRRTLDYAALDYYCKFRLYLPFVFPRADTWEVYPEGMYNALKRYHERYKLPVMVAENGMATYDLAPRKDRWTRSAYTVAHLRQVQRAMADGVPVLGYIHWSITDNYEWGSFSPRFGLFSVDCRNGDFTRRRADGADAFAEIIRAGGVTDALAARWPAPRPAVLPQPWLTPGGTNVPVSILRR